MTASSNTTFGGYPPPSPGSLDPLQRRSCIPAQTVIVPVADPFLLGGEQASRKAVGPLLQLLRQNGQLLCAVTYRIGLDSKRFLCLIHIEISSLGKTHSLFVLLVYAW